MKPPRTLWIALAALTAAFALPLARVAGFALQSELYSYILVIVPISLGLVWMKVRGRAGPPAPPRTEPEARPGPPRPAPLARDALPPYRGLAAGFFAAGAAAGAAGLVSDELGALILAYVLLIWGLCAWFLDRRTLVSLVFPLAFLLGLVPIPAGIAAALTTASQHASAAVAAALFAAGGIPVYQPGDLVLQLPGISLEVAPQCSGLHSSIALLITSLVAGQLLLRSPWRRTILCLAVVPIAILRNGFRIFVVGQLCVRVGPWMINSYIHRSGGWIFFLLSLVLLFALLVLLARSERPAPDPEPLARTRNENDIPTDWSHAPDRPGRGLHPPGA